MPTPTLLEKVTELTAKVGEVATLALPKSEADERFKKIEADLNKVLAALKDDVTRLTEVPGFDLGAASWFAKRGYLYLPRPASTAKTATARRANAATIRGVSIFKTDPWTLQTTRDPAVPEEVKAALESMDLVYILDKLFEFKADSPLDWEKEKAGHEGGARGLFMERFPEIAGPYDEFAKAFHELAKKNMSSSAAGLGDEWVPTVMATNLLDIIRLAMPVTNLIPHVFQPSNPWQNPLLTSVPIAYRKLENTAITESDLATGNLTWTAHIFGAYTAYSDELDDDSAIAIAPAVRSGIIRALGEGLEEALVNGDGDNAGHFDNDYQTGVAPFRTYQGGVYGLRHFIMDDSGGTPSTVSGAGTAITHALVASALATMGKFGANRLASGEVVGLCTAQQWIQLLTEASSPIVTVDKYGSQATLLTGELGRLYGVPFMVSHGVEQRKDSVAATGQNTVAGPNTLSTALLFNRFNWRIGDRRDFRLERDKDIVAGRNDVVGTARWSMQSVEGDNEGAGWDPSTVPAAVAIVNID